MAVFSKVAMPFTPIMRRFLADIFKPAANTTLGKRVREDSSHHEYTSGHPRNISGFIQQGGGGHLPNCVALQNDDTDEDAVVITALNILPFCCHADLLTMSRDDLVRAANTLNDKLPLAMRIDVSAPRSDAFIRNSIELLVGIRSSVPPAPKANKSMNFVPVATPNSKRKAVDDNPPPSPASPLANKSARHGSFTFVHSPPLAALDEADEEDDGDGDEERSPLKPLRKKRRIIVDPVGLNSVTPSPISRALLGRSQSQRTPRSNINSPFQLRPADFGTGMLRSQSQRLPQRRIGSNSGVYRNVTLNRGRGTSSQFKPQYPRSVRSQSAHLTAPTVGMGFSSTPKKRKHASESDASSSNTSSLSEPLSSISFPSPPAPSPVTPEGACEFGVKLNAAGGEFIHARREFVSVDAGDVTAGLEGMSMADEGSGSDMDISLE
ncbi:hypothetical protein EIP91_005821 [Steccherinum ochraceum]|uniref:Uncharacterized protein n=1 Tax=Steccherinum ochraceum TaxID=92696 RepID=A0A4R0R9A5_9APHY|nr:hypothetical protein EIP91_005821 [Steccherinum ochraceum]